MRREKILPGPIVPLLVLLGVLFQLGGILLVSTPALAKRTQYVQVRNAKLRSEPKSYASVVANLNYKDEVEEVDSKNGWLKVTAKGRTGYIHETALTTSRIVSSTKDVSPFSGESDVVLAGKGFSQSVEDQYKKQNPNSKQAFVELDRLERTYSGWNPSIQSFRKSGKLEEQKEG